ncbi:MAG TPA: Uma2 family endonuclease [Thermoanaerobaculia bacterium]|nr:Uma2 family endonuclease [Thermoanaerobaculia bacterium]
MGLLSRTEERLVTGEELLRRPDLEPCELVEGKIVPMSPVGFLHGKIGRRIARPLEDWSENRPGTGEVVSGEVGIYIRRDPDTVRAADILYISTERLAGRAPVGYLEIAPELIVEILSPDKRRGMVEEKLKDYFAVGVDLVWVVDPEEQYVLAYRGSLFDVERFGEGDVLMDEEILPGFSLPVANIFRE